MSDVKPAGLNIENKKPSGISIHDDGEEILFHQNHFEAAVYTEEAVLNSKDEFFVEMTELCENIRQLTAKRNYNFEHLTRKQQIAIKEQYPEITLPIKVENVSVDVIQFMKNGTSLLKYGRRGHPHFRFFEIDLDSTYLQYYSSKHTLDKTRIRLCTITDIIEGQESHNFSRVPKPTLENCSFSIKYEIDGETRSLDLIAKNRYEYRLWVHGIKCVMKYFKKDANILNTTGDTFRTKSYIVAVPPLNQSGIARNLRQQPPTPANIIETDYKVAFDRYNHTMHLFKEKHRLIKSQFTAEKIEQKLKQSEINVKKIRNEIVMGHKNALSHAIWLASVELKVIQDMITAATKA